MARSVAARGSGSRAIETGECPEWQRELTVNQPPHGFAGSSPASPTIQQVEIARDFSEGFDRRRLPLNSLVSFASQRIRRGDRHAGSQTAGITRTPVLERSRRDALDVLRRIVRTKHRGSAAEHENA